MPAPIRPRHLPMLALAAGAALAMSGCLVMPPALPTAAPAQPTVQPQPEPTEQIESTEPSEPSPSADGGDLPDYVDFGTALEPGTLAGWETSILTDADFTVQPESDFPVGPTISVVQSATGCSFWAYQGAPDSASSDEEESSLATLTAFLGGEPESTDLVDLGPSASQGTTVVFLSTVREDDAGATEVLYARNFQSSQSTSAIRATCPAGAGDLESIDEVVFEHFQVNFLAP
ncbi:MAG: hypothetical protein ACQEWM_08825 [Actinomycetota bacterium]